jgi:hypothetical protein
MFIPGPNFSIPDPRSRVKKILDPGPDFSPITDPDPGVKKAPDPGSATHLALFYPTYRHFIH